jgi:hypothetical protein
MDKTYTLKARSVIRPLVLLSLVVGLSLAFAGAASAQTIVPFQATVDNISTNGVGNPGPSCVTYYCGNAIIAGYGAALWQFAESPDVQPTPVVGSDCWHYTGTSTFTLVRDGSALVLNESNVVACFPGNSGNTPNFWKMTNGHQNPWGHPSRGGDTPTGLTPTGWTVCSTFVPPPDPSPEFPPTGCGELIDPNDPNSELRYSTVQFSELTGGSGTGSIQSNGAILTGAWSGTLTFQ